MRLILLVLLFPLTAAQVEVGPIEPPRMIMPEVEHVPVVVPTTIDCLTAMQWAPDGMLQFTYSFDGPADIIITGPATVTHMVGPCTGPITFEDTFRVAVTRQLLGLVPHPVTVTVQVEGMTMEGEGSGSFGVTADYVSLLQVRSETSVKEATGGTGTFRFAIENFGNAATEVRLAERSGIRPMEPIVLGPFDGTGEAVVLVDSDGRQRTVELTFTPYAVDDPSKSGRPQQAKVVLREPGVLAPGPTALLVVVVLGLAAWRRP